MITYTKPHLTYLEQIKLLMSPGLIINDKELRILTFSAIEKIEIFLRTSIAYNFSKKNGAFDI